MWPGECEDEMAAQAKEKLRTVVDGVIVRAVPKLAPEDEIILQAFMTFTIGGNRPSRVLGELVDFLDRHRGEQLDALDLLKLVVSLNRVFGDPGLRRAAR